MAERLMTTYDLRYLAGIGAALIFALVLTALWMQPPADDFIQLAGIYGLTALASASLGIIAHRTNAWRRLGGLAGSLTIGYVLAALLTLINVWVAARLMFFSNHDLALAGVLLLFASGVSVSFGYLISKSVASSLSELTEAAEKISQGEFGARVPISGEDEVSVLAASFNRMASRLEMADREASRLEAARRDFVAWVSHDLRTPLASLKAMIEAMAEGVVEDRETVDRYLEQSRQEINRLSELIDDLFSLSQLDSGHLQMSVQVCALGDLISDAMSSMQPRARAKGITLSAEVERELDPVRVSPRHVERALHNLLDNALRHTPQGGAISVEAQTAGSDVLISVSDDGPGVPEEAADRIFDRFYRYEDSRARAEGDSGGAGLGLAIAKGMIEAHGGGIWLEPEGSGATFHLVLPEVRQVN